MLGLLVIAPVLLYVILKLTQTMLVMAGRNKDQLLGYWQLYGREVVYHPILSLLSWSACFVLVLHFIPIRSTLVRFSQVSLILSLFAAIVFPVIQLTHWHYGWLNPVLRRLPRLPSWYTEIIHRTSRYERRRIAYMWLRLPPQLRTVFNGRDQSFLDWADFVIMGSVLEEDFELTEAALSQRGKLPQRLLEQSVTLNGRGTPRYLD